MNRSRAPIFSRGNGDCREAAAQGDCRVFRASGRATEELAKGLELDELVVVTWTYDPVPRHRSYELLAEAFGLGKTEPHSA